LPYQEVQPGFLSARALDDRCDHPASDTPNSRIIEGRHKIAQPLGRDRNIIVHKKQPISPDASWTLSLRVEGDPAPSPSSGGAPSSRRTLMRLNKDFSCRRIIFAADHEDLVSCRLAFNQ